MSPKVKQTLFVTAMIVGSLGIIYTPMYFLWQELVRAKSELIDLKSTVGRTQSEVNTLAKEQRSAMADLDRRMSPIPGQLADFRTEFSRDLLDHEKMLSQYFEIQRAGKSIVATKRKDNGQSIIMRVQ